MPDIEIDLKLCFQPVVLKLSLPRGTPARRSLPVTLDANDLIFYCLVVSGLVGWARHLTGYSTLPPHTWARTADQQTRHEVEAATSMAFNMARNAPKNQRHNNLRDATFLVPHELARLNKEAPDFHLEDLGPMAEGKIPWDTALRRSIDGPPLDAKTETRVFLYFPNGSSKATAVFLAVNSELKYQKNQPSSKAIALQRAFRIVYEDWEHNRPSVTGRIMGMERLPVICNFQENVFGSVYYARLRWAGIPMMALTPLVVTDLGLKTSVL